MYVIKRLLIKNVYKDHSHLRIAIYFDLKNIYDVCNCKFVNYLQIHFNFLILLQLVKTPSYPEYLWKIDLTNLNFYIESYFELLVIFFYILSKK